MKTLLIILLSFFLLNCKKNEPKCFLVQEEWTTVYKPNSPNFYRYGDDNIDEKKISYIECNLFKIDSLLELGDIQPINDTTYCLVIHRVITKNKRD